MKAIRIIVIGLALGVGLTKCTKDDEEVTLNNSDNEVTPDSTNTENEVISDTTSNSNNGQGSNTNSEVKIYDLITGDSVNFTPEVSKSYEYVNPNEGVDYTTTKITVSGKQVSLYFKGGFLGESYQRKSIFFWLGDTDQDNSYGLISEIIDQEYNAYKVDTYEWNGSTYELADTDNFFQIRLSNGDLQVNRVYVVDVYVEGASVKQLSDGRWLNISSNNTVRTYHLSN